MDTMKSREIRMLEAAFDGNTEAVQRALDEGIAVDASPVYWNALHYAIENLRIEMVQFLLQHGADPDTMCGGFRPLHHAIDAEYDAHPQTGALVSMLLEAGADVQKTDEKGQTPLHMAIECGCHEAERMLRMHGAIA